MSSRLIYVMDPMCSWCWGFAPVVQALTEQAQARGATADLVVGGLRQERIAMDQAARERTVSYWHAVHEASGQPFDLASGLPEGLIYDTEPACRALVAARSFEADAVWRLAPIIQRAFYVEGRDVTLPPVLVELAEEAGIPAGDFSELFDSQGVRDTTAADFDWARNLGIAGFPTLLAEHDGQLVLLTNGFQPLEALAPLLTRWLDHNLSA